MVHKASVTPAKMASATTAASVTEGRKNEVQAGIVLAATASETGTAAAAIVGLEIEAIAGTDAPAIEATAGTDKPALEATAGIDDPAIEVTAGTGGQKIEVTAATDDREIEEIGTEVVIATEEIGNEKEETETVVTVEAANEEIEERPQGGLDRGADAPYLAKKVTVGVATEAVVASKNAAAAMPTRTNRIPMEVAREAPGSGVALEQRQLACRRLKR